MRGVVVLVLLMAAQLVYGQMTAAHLGRLKAAYDEAHAPPRAPMHIPGSENGAIHNVFRNQFLAHGTDGIVNPGRLGDWSPPSTPRFEPLYPAQDQHAMMVQAGFHGRNYASPYDSREWEKKRNEF